ncbi:MAG TPA: hypothetical protein VIP46_05895 [Pyrinomonadaceae bacterium]
MEILSYPYRPQARVMLLASIFFGAVACFMGREAMVNDRGLIVNGLIHLEPGGATTFYWCIAAIGAAFTAVGIPAFFVGLLSPHRVVLTSTDISAPKYGFSRKATTVKLSDIRGQSLQVVQENRFLNIYHVNGKLTISESFLPDEAAFKELCAAIAQRAPTQPGG